MSLIPRLAEIKSAADFDAQFDAATDTLDRQTLVNGAVRLASSSRPLLPVLQRVLQRADCRALLHDSCVDDFVYTVCSRTRNFDGLFAVCGALRDEPRFMLSNATATAMARIVAMDTSIARLDVLMALLPFFRPGTVHSRLTDAFETTDPEDFELCDRLFELLLAGPFFDAKVLFYNVARLRRADLFARLFAVRPFPDQANRALRVAAASNTPLLTTFLAYPAIRASINLDGCLPLRDAIQARNCASVAALLGVAELAPHAVVRALQSAFQQSAPLPLQCIKLLIDDPRVDPLTAEALPFAVPIYRSVYTLASVRPEVPELHSLLWMIVCQRLFMPTWPLSASPLLPPYVMLEVLDWLHPACDVVPHALKLAWLLQLRKSVER